MAGNRTSIRATCHCSALLMICVITFAAASPLHAQVEQIGNMTDVPPQIRELRAAQAQLAAESDIVITISDQGRRSASMLGRVVPLQLRDEIIVTEDDLIGLLDVIYPYYGFTGTETLQFQRRSQLSYETAYEFREYIAGIETSALLTIYVSPRTQRITWFSGWLELDRDLERMPQLTRDEAIATAICVVRESGRFDIEGYRLDGPNETEVIYERWGEDMALAPTWRVRLAAPQGQADSSEAFSIGPNGEFRRELNITHVPDVVTPQVCLKN